MAFYQGLKIDNSIRHLSQMAEQVEPVSATINRGIYGRFDRLNQVNNKTKKKSSVFRAT